MNSYKNLGGKNICVRICVFQLIWPFENQMNPKVRCQNAIFQGRREVREGLQQCCFGRWSVSQSPIGLMIVASLCRKRRRMEGSLIYICHDWRCKPYQNAFFTSDIRDENYRLLVFKFISVPPCIFPTMLYFFSNSLLTTELARCRISKLLCRILTTSAGRFGHMRPNCIPQGHSGRFFRDGTKRPESHPGNYAIV